MAIYTQVTQAEIDNLLTACGLGVCQSYQAATTGIENTTYLLTTQSSAPVSQLAATPSTSFTDRSSTTLPTHTGYVLTLFETQTAADTVFYAELLNQLVEQHLPVPKPWPHLQQGFTYSLKNRPALIMSRLPGSHPTQANAEQVQQISQFLARLHNFDQHQQKQYQQEQRPQAESRHNPRDFIWITQQQLLLDTADQQLMQQAIHSIQPIWPQVKTLPQTIIHGDLFPDNALFVGDQLTGVIDFYNAHTGPAIWDMAIAILAWCSNTQGQLDSELAAGMLHHYQQIRPFSCLEQQLWPHLLHYAALRFWVSRLLFWQKHPPHAQSTRLISEKSPQQFKILLKHLLEK